MSPDFRRVAIYTKPDHARAAAVCQELAAWLRQQGCEPLLTPELPPGAPPDSLPALAVLLGGDGTMLHQAPRLARSGVPVFAVHLGTLGFLTETALEDLYPSLERILHGGGARQTRALLRARLERAGAPLLEVDALNEIAVGNVGLARLIHLQLSIAGEPVGEYRADGLIVATPTGSTAYSFSAGGAVLHPSLEALIVTPICPHALGQRPLVVGDHAGVAITLQAGGEAACLTADGQQGWPLEPGDRVVCRRSPYALTLLSPHPRSFFEVLRTKLHWGPAAGSEPTKA